MIDPRLERIVAAQPHPLLFAIRGGHLYGFPSPDSDFDLRGTHVVPLEKVVGLAVRDETIEGSRVIEGLEMDIASHDVKKFFGLLLKKNGYVLEQLYSPLDVQTTAEHEELKEIAIGCITRHHSHPGYFFPRNGVLSFARRTSESARGEPTDRTARRWWRGRMAISSRRRPLRPKTDSD